MSDWQTVPYIFAECQDCDFRIDEHEKGQRAKERAIRRHSRQTKHKMRIEVTKTYYYEDREHK